MKRFLHRTLEYAIKTIQVVFRKYLDRGYNQKRCNLLPRIQQDHKTVMKSLSVKLF